jgi:ubiquinone/menaquinone biosynthesis C-methylase UbiE
MTFPDHFSPVSAQYAASRPRYPDALFAFLAQASASRRCVWDAGCGSGQASVGLAAHFERVIATDASASQIANAEPHPRIEYSVAAGTNPGLSDHSIDLVTVAQALHWFDRPAFYADVARVLKPDGLLAAWTYGLTTIAPETDHAVVTWYRDALGPYWPPERQLVEDRYRDIDFPYAQLPVPALTMTAHWTRDQFVAYLGTWSAVKEFSVRHGGDALSLVVPELVRSWPHNEAREVSWPLTLLVGGPSR